MNREMQARINESMRTVRFSNKSGSYLNCIRLNPQSKGPHNDKMIELCKGYLEMGIPFYTEVIFEKPYSGRADILLPSQFEIVEVLHTESDARFNAKSYPDIFKISKVRA